MDDNAEYYYKHGLRLIIAGRLDDAVEFFTKAIELNPKFVDAYRCRGQVFLETDRIIQSNADLQKAREIRSGVLTGRVNGKSKRKNHGKPVRLNWQEVDDIYDAVFPVNCQYTKHMMPFRMNWQEVDSIYDTVFPVDHLGTGNETPELDDNADQHVFRKVTVKKPKANEGDVKPFSGAPHYPAILEFISGRTLEAARVRIFEPTYNDVSIIREDGFVERVISLENMACLRLSDEIPPCLKKNKNSFGNIEIIETAGGKIYHQAIHPDQDLENVLFGISTKETRFMYTFIPKVNIRKRYQKRFLGEILSEMNLIDDDALNLALKDHQRTKSMRLGEIIAQKNTVTSTAIEKELKLAKKSKVGKKLKTGKILLQAGLVNEEDLSEALQQQECLQKMKFGQFLVETGSLKETEVCLGLAEKYRFPFVDLQQLKISRNTLTLLPRNFVLQNEILPISLNKDILSVAILNPDTSCLQAEIIQKCECREVRFSLALPSHLRIIIDLLYNSNVNDCII